MDAITILVAVLSSTALSQLITFFVTRHDNKKACKDKKIEDLTKGQVALLHNSIFKSAIEYLEKGQITTHEMDNLKVMYESYRNMGGNGTAKLLMEKVENKCKIVED